jgi:CBS domain-containing membrane protein
MALLRCVHPPSGAVALTAVLGGPHVTALGFDFVLAPVGVNSLILTAGALAYNNATGRSWPHHAHQPTHPHEPPPSSYSMTAEMLEDVIADYGEALDISRDDLEVLFRELVARMQGVA